MKTEEHCENCKKEITKEMKASQQVIYAGAEHTLTDDEEGFCNDEMFSGVFCCQECYNEIAGINLAYRKGKKEMLEKFEKLIESCNIYTARYFEGQVIDKEELEKKLKQFKEGGET